MNEVIESIEDALDKECWIPALALALTLPDTCGSIEYPEMVNNKGRRLSKRQYLAWFKEHVEHRFADHTGFDDKGNAVRTLMRTCAISFAVRSCIHQTTTSTLNMATAEKNLNTTMTSSLE